MFFNAKSDSANITIETTSKYYASNIEEFFCKTEMPEWVKNIESHKFDIETSTERLRHENTIKTCPAFIDVIKNSFSYKAPCDIELEINENIDWRYFSPWNKIEVTNHNVMSQMGPSNPFYPHYLHLKYNMPFSISSDVPIDLMFLQPMYHNYLPFTVIPGSLNVNKKLPLKMNLNTVVEVKDILGKIGQTKKISIKRGQVLAYLYFGKQKINSITAKYITNPEDLIVEHLHISGNYIKLAKNLEK